VKVETALKNCGIDLSKMTLRNVWEILDFDNSGDIEIEEFTLGLQQLHGDAKSIDIARLNHAVHKLHLKISEVARVCSEISTAGYKRPPSAPAAAFGLSLDAESADLDALRKLSWSGIPMQVRSTAWQLLSAYLPANKDRRQSVLTRKRNEYFNFVKQYYDQRSTIHQETYHQIHIDIPRTNPLIPLFQQEAVQHIFERLLFIWAVRHPASGYVQGINDLVTPFFIVFLTSYISPEDYERVETFDVGSLDTTVLENIEADTFWCMSKLLDGIQDNYTFAQPGIQKKVSMLRELTKRVDADLHAHLESENIEYLQFAFRWMNNLLMREIPLRCTIRLWDTYFAEADGFCDFHIYVCAAFLKQWRNQLLGQDFQELMLTIQNVPTNHWGSEEVKLLLAEAFRLKYTFHDSKSHLTDGPNKR